VLTQAFGRRQPVKVKSLAKERLIAVFADGIKMRLTHSDQSDHRTDDVDVRYPVVAFGLWAEVSEMIPEFLLSQLLANKSQPGR